LKIDIVNKFFLPVIGGVETVVGQHAIALSKNHEVTIACATANDESIAEQKCGSFYVKKFFTNFTLAKTPFSLSLLKYMVTSKADIFYLHHPYPFGFLVALLSSKKIVVYYHSDIITQKFWLIFFSPIQKLILKRAIRVYVSSPVLRETSQALRAVKHKVHVMPIGLSLKKSLVLSRKERKYHLYLGRFAKYKGLEVLIDAIALCDPTNQFMIVGSGEDASVLSKISKLKNVKVISRHVSEDEKNELLAKAISFVFPSITPNEAFGIVQLEAMQCGVPIINTNIPSGVPWVARNRLEAITVDANDPIALKDAIEAIQNDDLLWCEMSKSGQERVLEFSQNKLDTRILNEFEEIENETKTKS
jgi:glycosyltransferase involved in cell wall biosynthesis